TIDEELPMSLYAESTRSKLLAPCRHCGEFVHPYENELRGWRDADSEMKAAKLAHWICPKCERRITEKQRAKMLIDTVLLHEGQRISTTGKITGPKPESTRLWYHATPFFNMLLEPGDIGKEEWVAERIPEDTTERIQSEKERAQFRWSKTYTPPKLDGQIELDRKTVADRQNKLPPSTLPDDVQLLTIAYDTGDKRGWFAALASRPNGELIVPAYGDFDIRSDLATPENAILAALREQKPFLEAGLPKVSGGTLIAHRVGCDAGWRQAATWKWTKEINERQSLEQWVMATRGRGETQIDKRKWTCPKNKGNLVRQISSDRDWYVEWIKKAIVFELHFDADNFKLLVQHGLTLAMHSPGSISLHAGTKRSHSRIARHCTNERLLFERHPEKGIVSRWVRFGDNHLLDCLAQCYAMLVRLGYQPPPLPTTAEIQASNIPQVAKPSKESARPKEERKEMTADESATERRRRVDQWFGIE
ncbi:MAG: terminase gpA endonuclease subunit, partial [Planctomycetota bacterium]